MARKLKITENEVREKRLADRTSDGPCSHYERMFLAAGNTGDGGEETDLVPHADAVAGIAPPMIPNERMPGRRVQSHDRGRAKGSEHFRKQNQTLGRKASGKAGESTPRSSEKQRDYRSLGMEILRGYTRK